MATLEWKKGLDVLVRAFAELRRDDARLRAGGSSGVPPMPRRAFDH